MRAKPRRSGLGGGWRTGLRWVGGLLAIFGSLYIWIENTYGYSTDVSAVQVTTQRYAGGILATTITLGICIGLYIISRAGDSALQKQDAAMIEQRRLAEGKVKCPFCAEIIKGEAKVCRYCGRDLPDVGLWNVV